MISIIIPVVRPEGAARCIKAIEANAGNMAYEIVSEVDVAGIGCPKMVSMLVEKTRYDWVMFLGDDTIPEPGFLENAVAAIGQLDGWGMVGLNDGRVDGNELATHWLCHKKMLDFTGGEFFHTGYLHTYCDKELTDIANDLGRYVWAEDAKIKHDAQVFIGGRDEHTDRAYLPDNQKHDLILFLTRKESRRGPYLGVGFPVVDSHVPAYFHYSMMLQDFPPHNLYWPKHKYYPSDIAKCRNDICSSAISDGCTHILMLDTDQVYQDKQMVKTMLAHGKDIVGGKVHRRWPPFDPVLNRGGGHVPDEEISAGGLVNVDSTGTGCLMIRTRVLVDIGFPWFQFERNEHGDVTLGEDIFFCRKAKAAGYEIYVDCDVNIDHMTQLYVNEGMYKIWQKITAEV